MGRHPSNKGYLTPKKQTDATDAPASGSVPAAYPSTSSRGWFTLAAGTWLIPLGGQDCPIHSAHCQWDANFVATGITVEDCDAEPADVSDVSVFAGDWIDEDPSTAFVGTVGAGVTVTNGVVAVAGGAAGGCMFHIADTGARRTRLRVVVGTQGIFRCSSWGKE